MKLKFLTTVLLAGSSFFILSCSEDKHESNESWITYADLPEASKTIITSSFADASVTKAVKKHIPDADGTVYETHLSNNFEIDFDVNGNTTDIDGNHQKIPDNLILPAILSYVQQHYPAPLYIESIDKEIYGYEVELSNDIELKFDPAGKFISVDWDHDGNPDEVSIPYNDLPLISKNFLQTHFLNISAIAVTKNVVADADGTLYEVKLANGTEVDFDTEGNWTEIDGNNQKVPESIILNPIRVYVGQNYATPLFIEGISKKLYGYKVEISNDVNLKFDLNGNYLGIDH